MGPDPRSSRRVEWIRVLKRTTILRSWRRLLAGAGLGLVTGTATLVAALVYVEWRHLSYADGDMAQIQGAVIVLASTIGAALGVTTRRRTT